MLLASCGYLEIARKLGVHRNLIVGDVHAIFRAHGIKAKGFGAARRALAEQLGLKYLSRADQLRIRVAELREKGLTWKEIVREMGASERTARRYGEKKANEMGPELRAGTTPLNA
jgi:hypothetical protein